MKNKFLTFGLLISTSAIILSCKCEMDSATVNTNKIESDTVNVAQKKSEGTLDENNNYVYNIGELSDLVLPNGDTLNIGSESSESKLFAQLNDKNFKVSDDKTQGWITLDRVYFETGKSNVTENSNQQVENISKILKAFPQATVKVGGYTDNVGDSIVNLKVSTERANSITKSLVSKGIGAGRITSEGYGAQHFLCPTNDSDLCKAQNRRVDIRVTKK